MSLVIEVLRSKVLRATYRGEMTLSARRAAKMAIGKAAAEQGITRVLIDLRSAELPLDARIAAIQIVSLMLESPAFGRVAYLKAGGVDDAVAGFLMQYAPHGCRIFDDESQALDWLMA